MEFSISNLLFILFLLWPLLSRILGKNKQNKKGIPTSDEQILTESEVDISYSEKADIQDRVFSWDELLKEVQTVANPTSSTPAFEATPKKAESRLEKKPKVPRKSDEFRLPGTVHIKPLAPEATDVSSELTVDLSDPVELRKAFVYREIFDKPLALRKR